MKNAEKYLKGGVMKLNKKMLLFVSLAIMASMPVYARYKSDSLKKIYQEIDTSAQESLYFDYKVLNAKDCKKYFNSKSLIKKGYQPIYITFTNNSKNSIAIAPENFSFRCAHAQDVANNLHRDGVARGVGFGLGAIFFAPLIIPALVQGLGAVDYNEQMDLDFANKAFKKQVVPAYTTVDGVIFASRDQFSRNFTITLKDVQSAKSYTLSSSKYKIMM